MQKNKWKNLKICGARGLEVKLKQEIGLGAFSSVYSTSDNDTVAKLMNLSHDGSRLSYENESNFFEKIPLHKNIISFMGSRTMELDSAQMGIVLIENCPKGSIDEIMSLSARNQLSQAQIIRIVYFAAKGLAHIHSHGYIHRDIKIQNILLGEDGEYKLCDFGSVSKEKLNKISDCLDLEKLSSEITANTTPMYRAPEQLDPIFFKDFPLSEKVDIFALGVLAYVLCYKTRPFESALGAISGCYLWPDLPPITDEFQHLIARMLQVDPNLRPNAYEILETITDSLKFDIQTQGFIEKELFSSKTINKEAKETWLSIIQTKFLGAFFDTRGWIKSALSYNEYGPSQQDVRNLLSKAWKKPTEKPQKFFCLLESHMAQFKENTIISLKALDLLHSYLKKGPPEAISTANPKKPNAFTIMSELNKNWVRIEAAHEAKKIDPKRSSFSSQLIINLSRILLQKIELHREHRQYIYGNFSLQPFLDSLKNPSPNHSYQSLNPKLLLDLLNYFESLLNFVNSNLLAVGHLWNLQVCIALSMVDEIYCVICLLLHLYKTLKLSTNFKPEKFNQPLVNQFVSETDELIRRLYSQSSKFFSRCSSISDSASMTSKVIPKLPLEALDVITTIPILTADQSQNSKSSPGFDISDHLSYTQTICGLRIPFSFGPTLIFSKSQSQQQQQVQLKQSQSANEIERSNPMVAINYPERFLQSHSSEFIYQKEIPASNQVGQKQRKQSKDKQKKQTYSQKNIYESENNHFENSDNDDDEQYINPNQQNQFNFLEEKQQKSHKQKLNENNFNQNLKNENDNNNTSAERIFAEFGFTNPSPTKEKSKVEEEIDFFGHIENEKEVQQFQSYQNDSIWGAFYPKENTRKPPNELTNQAEEPNLFEDFDTACIVKSENTRAINNFDPSHPALLEKPKGSKISSHSSRLIPNPAQKPVRVIYDAEQLNTSLHLFSLKSERKPDFDSFKNSEVPLQPPGDLNESTIRHQVSTLTIQLPEHPNILPSHKQIQTPSRDYVVKPPASLYQRQRADSENISDDEAEARFPLASVVASVHSKSRMSPSNTYDEDCNNHNNCDESLPMKKQSVSHFFPQHGQLIEYIRKQVSDEFYGFIVDAQEISIGPKIGSGNSCEVFRGICKNQDVAIKLIKLDNAGDLHLKEFQREIAALIKLKDHQNLLQLVAISSFENNFFILTRFCEGGTLFSLLHKQKQTILDIPWHYKISWLKDIACGMTYLHANSLIHRDLKSLNLLLDEKFNSTTIPRIRIADFGLTRPGTNSNLQYHSGTLGTYHWMAPECMRNEDMSQKSDVYSFAIVMWEMCARQTPYSEFKDITYIIKYVSDLKGRPNLASLPSDTPKQLIQLIVNCWDEDPKSRPTFKEIANRLQKCDLE